MSPPLETVSARISQHQRQQIETIGGDRGLSGGLREVVTAGLLALTCDVALLSPVDELQQLVTRLSFITGRRTGSGAWWCPDNQALPPTEQLNPVGDVIATPDAVALITGSAAVVVDLADGLLVARENGREVTAEVDLAQLMAPACLLPAAVAGLANSGRTGRRELGAGLVLELTGSGAFRLSVQGHGATAPDELVMGFAAELLSLITRSMAKSAAVRRQLNEQLNQSEVEQ